jgi:hypothetical protein
MKRIRVEVTRTDTYVIEIDEQIYNTEWHDQFKEVMFTLPDFYGVKSDPEEDLEAAIHEGLAINLATFQARMGDYAFVEGYGYVKRNGELPYGRDDFDENGNWLPEDQRRQPAEGLNIIIESEDSEIECEIEVLENSSDQ